MKHIITWEIIKSGPIPMFKNCNEFSLITTDHPTKTQLTKKWCIEPCLLPSRYLTYAYDILNFDVRPDDIWILTFPKCGSNWTVAMAWMLNNNLDYETDGSLSLESRHIFLEKVCLYENGITENTVEEAKNLTSPRIIRSHLPVQLLPSQLWTVKPKIIFTARNPKDTVISNYHYWKNVYGYEGEMSEFINAFLKDRVLFSPFHSHITNFWNIRNEENVLFLTYENMKANLLDNVKQVAIFLGKNYTTEALRQLAQYLSVQTMRNNPSINLESYVKGIMQKLGRKPTNSDYR